MPSTPDVEFLPDFNTPEKEEGRPHLLHPVFKHQTISPGLPPPTPETPESRKVSFVKNVGILLLFNFLLGSRLPSIVSPEELEYSRVVSNG